MARISLIVLILIPLACSIPDSDNMTYDLGKIDGFAELVGAGVKKLALSPVVDPKDMDEYLEQAEPIAEKYGVQLYRERELIVTDLFPADVASGKEVLLIYQGKTLDAYLDLKKEINQLTESDLYEGLKRRALSRRFGRMLSYTPDKINRLLSTNTSFRTLKDFGIRASNVFLYYDDLGGATDFYTRTLGLELLAEYDNASLLRIAEASYLILVDAAKGMHSADEPKSVALAFLTNQLPQWYDHLKENDIAIKYDYKPKEGGAHDGFVAIDPEGYLLEFETFKQHPENEDFIPVLNRNNTVWTANEGLGFLGSITWLYHKDLLAMEGFYQEVLGLKRVADQGWTKIYKVTNTGFIGLVDEKRGMNSFSEQKAVTVSFIIDDLDSWFDYVKRNQPFELRSEEIGVGPESMYRAFVGYGPEGYFLEFDRFYEHPKNETLMKYLYQD